MKNIIRIYAIVTSIQISFAQAPQKLWETFYTGALNGKDAANSVLTDSAGNVFVTGISFESFYGGDFTTIKYNANGTQIWADHFSNTQASYSNCGKRLVMDKFQNVYAVGQTALHNGDLAICKFNNYGRIWAKDYEPYWFSTYDDYGIDMDIDSSGNFYAIARVTSPNGTLFDMYIMKCDSSGSKVWEDNYTGASADDYPVSIAVSPGGSAYPLLQSFNFFGSGTQDITTIQYFTSGAKNWTTAYNGSGNADDYPTSIKIDGAQNQYISGSAVVGVSNDMVGIKQKVSGAQLWSATYNGTGNGNDTAISEIGLSNGLAVLTGKCRELLNGSPVDAIVTLLIDSGTIISTSKFYGSDSLGALPSQMKTDSMGNIYICGTEKILGGTENGCILKYDSNGNIIFNISYDAGLNLSDLFNSISVDNKNNIVVTGQTYTSSGSSNFVTVKYGFGNSVINETIFQNQVNIYPNPAQQLVSVELNQIDIENGGFTIYDMFGRELKNIYTKELKPGITKINIDVSGISNGIYFIRLMDKTAVFTAKVIVKK